MIQILFTSVLFFANFALAANPAPFDISALQQKFSRPAENNGPNCYNTTLISLGYMDEVIHVSPDEMKMYVKLFCQEQSIEPQNALNGAILVYKDDSGMTHTASSLGRGYVLEKYSYLGAGIAGNNKYRPGSPGEYLFHSLNDSAYYQAFPRRNMHVYHCAPKENVKTALSEVKKTAWAQQLQQQRQIMAREIARISPQDMESYLAGPAVNHIEDLIKILQNPAKDSLESLYMYSVVYSQYRQIYFLVEGYYEDCPRCNGNEIRTLEKAMKRMDEALKEFLENYR